MTKTTINLGGTTASWNDAPIAALMASMNDGSQRFLVMDFENTSGTNWALNTSVNGAPWVPQGEQNVGSQAVMTSDENPRVNIGSGVGASQWIDELVLWAGDKETFEQFTDEELSRVYELGNTLGVTMDQYGTPVSDSFDMYTVGPLAFSGSMNLYTEGPFAFSGSMPLYTEGPFPYNDNMNLFIEGSLAEAEGTTLRTINRFTKMSDHDPQLIGTFLLLASGVNIQVWDVVDGQNTPLALTSSGCYQVGNTERWGWSTANLPLTGKKKYHYYYRMTSTVDEIQLGEFFLTVPEGGRWSYPDSLGTHLVS